MQTPRWIRGSLSLLLVLGLASCSGGRRPAAAPQARASVQSPDRIAISLPPSPLNEEQRILHVLNRLGYGPRPGDLERVKAMGLTAYIRRQLFPETVPDPEIDRQLSSFPTLAMTTAHLLKEYPQPDRDARSRLARGEMSREEMRELYPPERRPLQITAELQSAKLLRAIAGERQLQEAMVDFWFNHFNVYAGKGPVRWMITSYERDAIRPHALGKFHDLLLATARHPAMLYYLDNWMSVRTDFQSLRPEGPSGLNENYARELLELHTLGVNGGYTQQDIIEVARSFTGWTIRSPRQEGTYLFRSIAHDEGEKMVLGRRIPAQGGERDGEQVIEVLVRHPSTARFIATKLARRFVADDPPEALVDRLAETFRRTDGDIRAMLVTIFTSPEFFSRASYRAKIKTPLELVASTVRAVGGTTSGGPALARAVAQMGEPLYLAQPPTGHPDVAEVWVNTGALLNRLNFALNLAENHLPGTRVDLDVLLHGVDPRSPERILDRFLAVFLGNDVSPETREILARQLQDPEITRARLDDPGLRPDVEKIAALVLGSPEFQRR